MDLLGVIVILLHLPHALGLQWVPVARSMVAPIPTWGTPPIWHVARVKEGPRATTSLSPLSHAPTWLLRLEPLGATMLAQFMTVLGTLQLHPVADLLATAMHSRGKRHRKLAVLAAAVLSQEPLPQFQVVAPIFPGLGEQLGQTFTPLPRPPALITSRIQSGALIMAKRCTGPVTLLPTWPAVFAAAAQRPTGVDKKLPNGAVQNDQCSKSHDLRRLQGGVPLL